MNDATVHTYWCAIESDIYITCQTKEEKKIQQKNMKNEKCLTTRTNENQPDSHEIYPTIALQQNIFS
jgi:hypothetical protein